MRTIIPNPHNAWNRFTRMAMSVMAVFGMTVPSALLWSSPVHADSMTLTATADSYISNNYPTVNYGTATPLSASSSANRTLLKFDTSSLTTGTSINSVTLKIYNTNGHLSGGSQVHVEPDGWTETGVTWNNQPTFDTTVQATTGTPAANTWSEITLPALVLTLGGNTDFAITYSTAGTVHQIAARESGNAAQLVVNYGTPPPPPSDVVIAAAGDIVQSSVGGYSYNVAMATGDQILNMNPSYVLLAGDGAYGSGTAEEWSSRYDPTWGRFKAKTLPAPGNHEYYTANAAGYFGYWGTQAGDPAKGYYATNVGNGWRIYTLNCGNDVTVGAPSCAAGSDEISWLQSDLAANSGMRFGAYLHYPRYTGSTEHPDNQDVKPAWDALLAAGADWMLAGHVHNYERFPKMDDSGNLSSTGMRSFVVGTGGAYAKGYGRAAGWDHSELRLDTHFGVMKMTLGANGYSWQLIGSGKCSTVDANGNYGNTDCPTEAGTVLDSGTEASNHPATSGDDVAPSVPTNLSASSITTTGATLSWTASTDNTGVSGYQILRDGTAVATVTGTTYTATALSPSTTYQYAVRAYDAAGNTSASTAPLAVTTSTAPVTVTATLNAVADAYVTNNFATTNYGTANPLIASASAYRSLLKFDTSAIPSGATINSVALSLYNTNSHTSGGNAIHPEGDGWTETGVTWNNQPTYDTTVLATSATPLVPNARMSTTVPNSSITVGGNTNYVVNYSASGLQHQIASRESGANTPQLVVTYTLPDTTPPSVPTGISTTGLSATGVTLNWSAATDDVGVTGYQVSRDGTVIGTSSTPTYTDSGLTQSTVYNYTVKAYDAAGNYSAASTGYNVNTLSSDTTPPSTPGSLTSSGVTSTGLTLNWTASTDNVGVHGYEIEHDGVESGFVTGTTFSLTGLTPSTTYNFDVIALDDAANESAPATLSVTTTPATAKPSISGMTVSSVTSTTATVTAQVNPNGLATTANFAYGLTSSLGMGTANQNLGSGFSAVTMNGTITGLSPNTTYYVRAQGSNSAGGTYPTPITFTTAP